MNPAGFYQGHQPVTAVKNVKNEADDLKSHQKRTVLALGVRWGDVSSSRIEILMDRDSYVLEKLRRALQGLAALQF